MKNLIELLERFFSDNTQIGKKNSYNIAKSMIDSCAKDIVKGDYEKYIYLKNVWKNGATNAASVRDITFSRGIAGLVIVLTRRRLQGDITSADIELLAKNLRKKRKVDRDLYLVLSSTGSVISAISYIDFQTDKNNNGTDNSSDATGVDYAFIGDSLRSFRNDIRSFGEKINNLENRLMEESVYNSFNQLLQLYNLLSDIKNSIIENPGEENRIRLDNIEAIQEMIIEFIEDYGIETICSQKGTPYSGRKHEIYNKKDNNYDPSKLVIEENVRCGFVWGKTVVQKEKVIVRETDY